MPSRREHPLPNLPLSIEALPPSEKRTSRLTLSFTAAEVAMIERTAQERGEQPAVFCRIIVLTAFRNAAAKAMANNPGLLGEGEKAMPRSLRSQPPASPEREDYQTPAPFPWQDRAIFRETLLVYFTQPGVADLLRQVGVFFYGLMLESSGEWPDWPETQTRAELRGAVADLFQMQGFLSSIWKEGELSSVPAEDLPLCKLALDWSRVVARVAREIEAALGEVAP